MMSDFQLNLLLLERLGIDLVCAFLIVRGVYYRVHGRGDLQFTLITFNFLIFLIAYLLNRVEISLGAAFGLFAVFSMLRYRTEGISTTDMTYLFVVIALGLITAISPGGWATHGVIGGAIVACVYVLEAGWLGKRVMRQEMLYDNVQLVHTAARRELLADLRERTGLNIHRVDVQEIDFLRDAARLTIYYYPSDGAEQHENDDEAERHRGTVAGLAVRRPRADE